jgi:hypothetical protein
MRFIFGITLAAAGAGQQNEPMSDWPVIPMAMALLILALGLVLRHRDNKRSWRAASGDWGSLLAGHRHSIKVKAHVNPT